MALESFARRLPVTSPGTHVWAVLTDAETLAGWVGIVHSVTEIRHLERYRAVLQDRVGPFKLRADITMTVTVEVDGRKLSVSAAGRDRAVDSKIKVDAVLELSDDGAGTMIAVEGTYQVTGKVAAMGGGVIHKKADRILDDFFVNAERALSGTAVDGRAAQ